jgi:hypothetical protein
MAGSMAATDIIAAQAPPAGKRTSDVLEALFAGDPDGRLTIAETRGALDERAFGFLILLFALPNGVPVPGPPGLSAILGIPIFLLAAQLVLGWREPWLPQWLLRRSVRRGDFARVVARALPPLRRIEKVLRPRHAFVIDAPADRMIGLLLLLFAAVLALPIPLGNLPPAYAIIVMAFALIERDGLAMLAGIVIGLLSVVWGGLIIAAGWAAVTAFTQNLLS